MPNDNPITQYIQAARSGNEEALRAIWNYYVQGLQQVAKNHLQRMPHRTGDEEDVVQSAFRSFFQAAQEGRYPDIHNRDDLWRLLITITACKSKNYIRHHLAEKRGAGRTRGDSIFQNMSPEDRETFLDAVSTEPTPADAALLAEEIDRLFSLLDDDTLCTVARMKLESFTNREIADTLQRSLATVERSLRLIRKHWQQELN